MIKDNYQNSLTEFQNIITKYQISHLIDNLLVESVHKDLYNLNELLYNNDNENSIKYRNEMFRNIFETIHLILIGKYVAAMHMLRSVIELYGKMQISRIGDIATRKFSENIDRFIKQKKLGDKNNKAIIISKKEDLKIRFYELCEYVHTGVKINIKPFEVMEEIFNKSPNIRESDKYLRKVYDIINLLIVLDLLAFSVQYYQTLPSITLTDFKTQYLNDDQKNYMYSLTKDIW